MLDPSGDNNDYKYFLLFYGDMNQPHPHHFLLRTDYTLADWWREKQEHRMSENERYRPRGLDDADEE